MMQAPDFGNLDDRAQLRRLDRSYAGRILLEGEVLKLVLTASGKRGVPQGGVISPLLANIYLNEVDGMLERAREVTREGGRTRVQYARYADDLVILVDGHPRQAWLLKAVDRRLREEFAKLDLRLNEEKSRVVDLTKGEAFGFLGFTIRRVQSRRGKWWPMAVPALKQRTVLLRRLREEFRRGDSQPVGRVIAMINPILRGWVNYFRIGNAARCFAFVKDWVEEGAAPSDKGEEPAGLRLETVE